MYVIFSKAFNAGLSPCAEIVKRAINQMPLCNVRDNISVVAIFLNTGTNFSGDFGVRNNTQTPIQVCLSTSPCSATDVGDELQQTERALETIFRV